MRFVVFKANVQTLFIKYKYKQNKVTRRHTRKKKAERAEHTACYNDIGTKKIPPEVLSDPEESFCKNGGYLLSHGCAVPSA